MCSLDSRRVVTTLGDSGVVPPALPDELEPVARKGAWILACIFLAGNT